MSKIDRAIDFAVKIHKDQKDLGDNPYILHPIHLLDRAVTILSPLDIKDKESVYCSIVMHDCIEDAKDKDWAALFIEHNFGLTIFKAVDSMTRRPNETWKSYINRLKIHWSPRFGKCLDLEHNLDNSRLKEITDKDINRNKMYTKTLIELKKIGGIGISEF